MAEEPEFDEGENTPGVATTSQTSLTDNIRDPFRRKLLKTFNEAQAESGGEAPGLLTNPPVGEGLIGGSTEEGGTEATPLGDSGIRQSILAQAQAGFESNLAEVQRNAERKRQTRSGVTSQNELREARIAQNQRIGMLGQFEAGERARREGIISDQASGERNAETQLQIARESIVANAALQKMKGDQTLGSIAAQGAQDRQTQEPRLLLERQTQTGQITGASQATMQSVNDAIFAGGGVDLALVNGVIGAEAHTRLAQAFTDEDGNFDQTGYEEALVSAVFRAASADTNLWDSATGGKQPEVSLGFRRAGLEDRQVALAERSALFNEQVVQAELTGIWKAYGIDELDEFTTAFNTTADGIQDGSMNHEGSVYNARYDFDLDGKIDYADYMAFANAASVGGIETVAMQELRETTRQFDVTTAAGIEQFNAEIDRLVDEGTLNRAQERYLTSMALKSNEFVIQEDLDVQRLVATVDLLASDAVAEFNDPEIDALTAIIMDAADVSADALATFGLNHQRRVQANELQNQFEDYDIDPDSYSDGFMGIAADNMFDWYEIAIKEMPNMTPERRAAWLQAADIDGNGDINAMDQFYFTVLND